MKLSTNDILVVVFVCLALITGRFAFSQGTQNLDTSLIEDLLTETSGVSTPTNGGVPDDSVTFDFGGDATDAPKPDSIWSIIRAGGIVGWVIILLSVAAGALIIEHLLTIRRSALIPQELADRLFQLVKSGERAKAVELCQANPGFLSNVMLPALMQPWSHWDYVEKAAEDALAEQTGRLYRKVDWLSLIGNIAPMLGLLGTVIGMIVAFRELSLSDGMARGADLAEGIYLALVTTVEGLLVAIPTLAIHSLLTNRVTTLAGDVAFTVEQILRPIKFAVKKTESTQ
ncbi:MAG: MotA/TolQ/ExbB proton channel family protein [Planctomycetaceae bacterium]|nr:MotA/TolQ/ExbB proton channel family protein [Planctomycetaceae bacterium]